NGSAAPSSTASSRPLTPAERAHQESSSRRRAAPPARTSSSELAAVRVDVDIAEVPGAASRRAEHQCDGSTAAGEPDRNLVAEVQDRAGLPRAAVLDRSYVRFDRQPEKVDPAQAGLQRCAGGAARLALEEAEGGVFAADAKEPPGTGV